MDTLKINEPLSEYTTRILRSYLKFPEGASFTAMDWKAFNGQFLHQLTSAVRDNRKLYGVSSDYYGCDTMKNEYGFERAICSDYKSEAKITNDVFSLMVVNPNIDRRLVNEIFEQVDPYNMPDFEADARAYVRRQEEERNRLQNQLKNQIDFGKLDEHNRNTESENSESEQEKEAKIELKIRKELENRIKTWRMAMKQQQKAIANMRYDTFLLQRATTYLRPGGILVFITPKEFIDDTITFKLVNQYEDIRIIRLDDEEYPDYRKCIVLAKKRRKATREQYELGRLLSRTKEKPFRTFGHVREVTATDEDRRLQQELLAQVDAMYSVLDFQSTPLYEVPISEAEEINSFRVGPVTAKEALEAINKSKVLSSYQETYSQTTNMKNPVAPTPLHKGHIMLLLTSGLLNGYIGKGVNQHLVKGSAIKDIHEFSEVEEDGTSKIVEREFYNIGVKLLDSNGEFRKIM
ncbi:hypothetical protein [Bacillus cereus]|uniref:hypothetical protein n=1 Tax=Bacillus cereus TaxID=1396 RepID=UPI0039810CB8